MIPVGPMPAIDWALMCDALETYRKYGYTYIETPWIVHRSATLSTLPPDSAACELTAQNPLHGNFHRYGDLTGSAEQGFVQLLLDGFLAPGKWVSAGPCFRMEKKIDALHQPYFFKVELMRLLAPGQTRWALDHLADTLHDAMDCMSSLTKRAPEMVSTDQGFDLEIDGIEVGSYGVRRHANHVWIYGTGLALPRISQACS